MMQTTVHDCMAPIGVSRVQRRRVLECTWCGVACPVKIWFTINAIPLIRGVQLNNRAVSVRNFVVS